MTFDYFSSVSATGTIMTHPIFLDVTNDTPARLSLYRQIAEEQDGDKRQALKKRLPAVTWQAHFPNGRRKNSEAVPSGLYMIDIDHIDNPSQVAQKLMPLINVWHIMVMHITPSRRGLRIVAKCDPAAKSIADNQSLLTDAVVAILPELRPNIDTCVKDLARLSYLVPWSYFIYFNGQIWTDSTTGTAAEPAAEPTAEAVTEPAVEAVGDSTVEEPAQQTPAPQAMTHFGGHPLTEIAERWLELRGGHPKQGERNSVLYELATRMRYITDFDPTSIYNAIPHCDLPDDEVMSLCKSACAATRGHSMPNDLRTVLKTLEVPQDVEDEASEIDYSVKYATKIPPLPIGLRDSLVGVPEKMRMPVLCGVLPAAMSYATDAVLLYPDGKNQRFNLMSIVYGKQASGKSSVKDVVDVWKLPMQETDKIARIAEDNYKELRRNRKANEKLPPAPQKFIKEVPITISCSTLLKRMKNANGKHLYSFGEELDTLRKTNGAGAWSAKFDVYRLAFDNGEWGQDYNSDTAESGVVKVAYNFTILGTLGAVRKCFKNDSVENGMSGRILFATMPSKQFEHMPQYNTKVSLSDLYQRDENIRKAVSILQEAQGLIETPKLSKFIRQWCDDKADQAAQEKDQVLDIFRKRSAVIGFRCAALYQILETAEKGKTAHYESKESIAFAELMAEYTLQIQIQLFADEMQQVFQRDEQDSANRDEVELSNFADVFTFDDLKRYYPEKTFAAIRCKIYRWKQRGLIKKIGTDLYQKQAK